MNVAGSKPLDVVRLDETLSRLTDGLVDPNCEPACWELVTPDAIPAPARDLLVHRNHMTTTLEAFHGTPAQLTVLQHLHQGQVYQRSIVLTLGATDRVVEFGVVRIDLALMSNAVRSAIVDQRRPLGEILISENVLRQIEPQWFLRFPAGRALPTGFDRDGDGDLYGRVGTIHCDGKPAITLLEIVTGLSYGGHASDQADCMKDDS